MTGKTPAIISTAIGRFVVLSARDYRNQGPDCQKNRSFFHFRVCYRQFCGIDHAPCALLRVDRKRITCPFECRLKSGIARITSTDKTGNEFAFPLNLIEVLRCWYVKSSFDEGDTIDAAFN